MNDVVGNDCLGSLNERFVHFRPTLLVVHWTKRSLANNKHAPATTTEYISDHHYCP